MEEPATRRTPAGLLRTALLGGALAALPAVSAQRGADGPLFLRLNLGPGDSPYVAGFKSPYEIDDGLARHWTRRRASVRLPLVVESGPRAVAFRFGPPPMSREESAEVGLSLGGVQVERFPLPAGGMQDHRADLPVLPGRVPVQLGFDVTWPGREDLGLWMDWVAFEATAGQRVYLVGSARWRAALATGLVFLVLLGVGWAVPHAALAVLPVSLAAAVALGRDPWLVHQLLTGVPEALALFGLALVAGARVARHRRAPPRDVAWVAGLMLAAFLARGLALNTPGYYNPDLRSHARLAIAIREAGLGFLADPAAVVARVGLWQNRFGGRELTFPYAPGFHFGLAVSGSSHEEMLVAEKLLGAAVSTVPLACLFVLARRIGASPLGVALLVAAPTYGRHLAVAFLPALFGHAADMAFLAWLAARLDRVHRVRVFAVGALAVAACQLAYVSALVVLPALLASLAAVTLSLGRGHRLREALALIGIGLAGTGLAVLLYFRSFLGPILAAAPGLLSPAAAASLDRVGFLEVVATTAGPAFEPTVLLAAIPGLAVLAAGAGRRIPLAWALAYLLLLLGRTLLPDLLRFQHETLFATPLVFLAAGQGLHLLGSRGRLGALAAALLGLLLVGQGAARFASDLGSQLGHAR